DHRELLRAAGAGGPVARLARGPRAGAADHRVRTAPWRRAARARGRAGLPAAGAGHPSLGGADDAAGHRGARALRAPAPRAVAVAAPALEGLRGRRAASAPSNGRGGSVSGLAPGVHAAAVIHPTAVIDAGALIGAGTHVWHF